MGKFAKVFVFAGCFWGSVSIASFHLNAVEIEASSLESDLKQVESLRNSGSYSEAREIVTAVIENAKASQAHKAFAEGLYQLALVQYFENEFNEARATMEIGRTHSRLHDMKLLEADFLSAEGVLDWKLGNLALAMPKLEAALEIQTEAREWVTMASISNNLGIIAYSLKDYGKAADHYRQGLDWLETHENDRLRASLYSNLAEVLIPVGELDEAEKYLSLALVIEEQSQEPRSLAYTYFNLGELKAGRGQSEEAILLYKKALALQIQVEDEWAAALTRLKHATELWKLGKMKNALEELEEGYATAQSLYALSLLRDYCSTMAGIHSELGNSGLQSYYSDLETNFSRRVQLEESPESAQAPLASTIDAGGISQEKALFSPLQAATVVLLCLLITTLAMEIARLRKRMKDI